MTKVLLLEDDIKLSKSLLKLFHLEGIHVTHIDNLEDLESQVSQPEEFDVVILDRLVHGFDSKIYVEKLRKKSPRTSILILSAVNTPGERTELINLGADDYVGKPFSSSELLARIKSLSRKYAHAVSDFTVIGNTTVDYMRRLVSVDAKHELLPAKEFLLFKALGSQNGKVCTRTHLLESVWGYDFQAETNVVESTIANLRKKLTGIGSTIKIKNSRNTGYWLET